MLLLLAEHSEAANHRHLCSVAAIKRPKKKEREREKHSPVVTEFGKQKRKRVNVSKKHSAED